MAAVRFLDGKPDYDLTYNDVFMAPNRSSVASPTEVDLTSTDGVGTPLPIVVANMTAISGRRMAETMARRGGIAILPQDIPTDVVAAQIAKVKAAHPTFETPIRVVVGSTVGDAMALIPKRAHGVAVVVDANRPVGIVSPAEFEGIDRFTQVQEVMTTDLTLVGTGANSVGGLRQALRTPPEGRPGHCGRRLAARADDEQGSAAVVDVRPGTRPGRPTHGRHGHRHQR